MMCIPWDKCRSRGEAAEKAPVWKRSSDGRLKEERGREDPRADEEDLAKQVAEADVVIVGLGCAGICAAISAREAGADVLKVESPSRPDGARSGPAAFFDLVNQGKQGAALDLRSPADRPMFERLLER